MNYHFVQAKETTTERLLAVADLLEQNPSLWEQSFYAQVDADDPQEIVDLHTCGTCGCMAGWGIAHMPKDELPEGETSWTSAGAIAFGINISLATFIFSADFTPQDGPSQTLRILASVPDAERTAANMIPRLIRELPDGIRRARSVGLIGLDLAGADLSDLNLGNVNMGNSSLSGANLSGANLSGAYLSYSDLRNARFDRAVLANTDLKCCKGDLNEIARTAAVYKPRQS